MLSTFHNRIPGATLPLSLVAIGLATAYFSVATRLIHDWGANDNYSHGFLIVPIAGYLVWQRRAALAATPVTPSWLGLPVMIGGLAMLAAGTLGAELFVARVSLPVVLAGAVLFLGGWRHLRQLAFPLAFLLLMIPVPAIVFNQVAFPLQLLASRAGESVLRVLDIPVLREGNIITLANTTLEVAEACSGIRSLVSLLTLSIVYAHFTEVRRTMQVALVLSTIPIAILSNGLRVAAIGIAAYYYGPAAAEGFFHSFSGWMVFVLALAMMVGFRRACRIPEALVRRTAASLTT
jgi:exosortase